MAKAESLSTKPSVGIIADDLTGAAELAGAAWRHGLSAEILTDFNGVPDADVVALDTDSRHCVGREAARRVRAAALQLKAWGVQRIYKKVDSVLRGNIVAEVEALMATLKQQRALLVPANPQLGRTIRDGTYFVAGVPLHLTDFRNDPQHPRRVSQVRELLDSHDGRISCGRPQDPLPTAGILIGDVGSTSDLQMWVERLDATTLAVGGAEFFAATLGAEGHRPDPRRLGSNGDREGRSLFVCGSMSASALEFLQNCKRRGMPVLPLPPALLRAEACPEKLLESWADGIVAASQGHRQVVAAIELAFVKGKEDILTAFLVAAVKAALIKASFTHIYAEGGATAAALIRALGWGRLAVVGELSPGIVTMRAQTNPAIALTIKPGSYHWPDALR